MWKEVVVLCVSVALATTQYASEDDAASIAQQQQLSWEAQQKVSGLPQYDASPAEESAYGSAPSNHNSPQNNYNNPAPQAAAPSQQQNFWWMNSNAFQKPANHPGVEPLQQQARPQVSQPKPVVSQNNRTPNSYNPPAPSQNSYNQPQQRPTNQYQQNSPSFGTPSRPLNSPSTGGGWTSSDQHQPIEQSANSGSGFNAPAPSDSGIKPATFECMLLNKADCHKSNKFQQPLPLPEESSGYGNTNNNVPKPQQNYQPPPPQQYQPEQPAAPSYTPQQPVQRPPPAGYYQPPSPQPSQSPNQFQSTPQKVPQNQSYQPQFAPDSQPASSFPARNPTPSKPVNNFQQPKPFQQSKPYQPQQQQYNRPLQNQQQSQNNAQSLRPTPNNNFNQQQRPAPAAYDDQLPYPGCPAAMLCVPENTCNLIGIIEDGLRLSESEKAHRVALSQCSEPGTGVEGVCCRDPNYKDPWPDMQGKGMGGGDHHHHHPDKGQGQPQQSAFQSSPNSFQPQQQQPNSALNNFQSRPEPTIPQKQSPSGGFRNPYAGSSRIPTGYKGGCAFNRRNASYSSSFTPVHKQRSSGYVTCDASETCILSYKCQQPSRRRRTNEDETTTPRRCNEDIFKNPYICCKDDKIKSPSFVSTATAKPLPQSTTTTTTSKPINTGRFSFSPTIPTTFIPRTSTESFTASSKKTPFRNNLLTNTLSPQFLGSSTSTESSLISGIGLRFHSHLHTKSAIEMNRLKPNPYNDESPAIIPLDSTTTTTYRPPLKFQTSSTTLKPELLIISNTERASNSIELLVSSPSNQKLVNQYTASNVSNNVDNAISRETKNVPDAISNSNSSAANVNGTSKNSNITSSITNSTDEAIVEKYEPVDVNKVPEPVPLKEEFSKSPPAGFIFKGDDLYLPEIDIPSQNFLPPLYDFGRKSLEELIVENSTTTTTEATTEMDQDETTTLIPFSENQEE